MPGNKSSSCWRSPRRRAEVEGQKHTAIAQIILMIPLMVISLPAGVLADRVSKRSVIVGMKVFEVVLMLAGHGRAVSLEPAGGPLAMGVLACWASRLALFSPAKYGILPEILPHERLSAGNGLLEMGSNLAILSGIVAGGVILTAAKGARSLVGDRVARRLDLGGLLLSPSLGLRPAGRPDDPAGRGRAGRGRAGPTVQIAWESIRADRILKLTLIGQILVWAIASLVPAPILPYASKVLHLVGVRSGPAPGRARDRHRRGVCAGRQALRSEGGIRAAPAGCPRPDRRHAGIRRHRPRHRRDHDHHDAAGDLQRAPVRPAQCPAAMAIARRPPRRDHRARERPGLCRDADGIGAGTRPGQGRGLAAGYVPGRLDRPAGLLRLGADPGPRRLLPIPPPRPGAHDLSRSGPGPVERAEQGGALLVPNHVSFADGLFLFASTDRPIRFVVYAAYFDRPILGWFLRAMKAIPISASGGPKMILHAFREAGKALDDGELVCLFPEGQLTRTGMMAPFQRGLQRIVKGRTTPIIPVHLDRLMGSIFSPASHRRWPERIPYPVTVSFGTPMQPDSSLHELRQAICELGQEAWSYRKRDRRPLHHEFVRRARRHPWRLAFADFQTPRSPISRPLPAPWPSPGACGRTGRTSRPSESSCRRASAGPW